MYVFQIDEKEAAVYQNHSSFGYHRLYTYCEPQTVDNAQKLKQLESSLLDKVP